MEDVASQLLRALRAHRSQRQLALRLGYRSNPVAEWEAGRRFPTAAEAMRVAEVCGVDVAAAFAAFSPPGAPAFGEDPARWLQALRGALSHAEIARRSGYSPHAIQRMMSGNSAPRLPAFLSVVQAITGRVSDLVAQLVDIARVPDLALDHRRRHQARVLLLEQPWAAAILALLDTTGVASAPRIAARLGLAVEEAEVLLAGLEGAGVVRRCADGFEAHTSITVDTSGMEIAVARLKAHWLAVGRDRVLAPREGDLAAYNVFAVSHEDLARLRELQRAYFRQVRGIIASSQPAEVVALLQLQLLRLDGDP